MTMENGLLDLSTKEMVIDFQYDYTEAYSDGIIPVCRYGRWGAVNLQNEEIISFDYDYISPFAQGTALAFYDQQAFLIDTGGNKIFTFDESLDSVFFTSRGGFYYYPFNENGIAYISREVSDNNDGMCYLITTYGEILLTESRLNLNFVSNNYIISDHHLYKVISE